MAFFCLSLILVAGQAIGAPQDSITSGVRVEFDPRVELMSMIQLLSGSPFSTRHKSIYRVDAVEHFEPFKDHEAVRLYEELSQKGLSFDRIPKTLLALADPPALGVEGSLHPDVVAQGLGNEEIGQLSDALSDFARASDFASFAEAHCAMERSIVSTNSPVVLKAVQALATYSGLPIENGVVVLGPLLHDGGFAARYDGLAYAFIGPSGVRKGMPDFGPVDRIAPLVSHEFAHLFVNPLAGEYAEEVQALAGLYEPIAEDMRRSAYPTWEIALNEHIIRAVTARLAWHRGGPEAEEQALAREEERGYRYVRALAGRLVEYEQDRQRYATFRDFYPRLLEALQPTPG